jgi:arginine-tRNA-protein transferase
MTRANYSIVEYFGRDEEGHHCGYCDGATSSISHGMWAHTLDVEDYQALIDRGWRRSGKYCYKPIMDVTCCPMYTIRLDVSSYNASKSQRKLARRFRNYIIKGRKEEKEAADKSSDSVDDAGNAGTNGSDLERMEVAEAKRSSAAVVDVDEAVSGVENTACADSSCSSSKKMASPKRKKTEDPDCSQECDKTNCDKSQQQKQPIKEVKPGLGVDPKKPKPRKAKDLRRERAAAKGKTATTAAAVATESKEKTMADLLFAPFPEDSVHKFEIVTLSSHTDIAEFAAVFDEEYEVYKRYQVSVHSDPPEKVTKSQFKRFLCNSSLFTDDSQSSRKGAFHQLYRIDGRLVMVGVVDVLAKCVSSKYLFYDPDFSFLSPGTLSSLYEIAFTQNLRAKDPEIAYYYMGYYIHSCPKMRYKSRYYPSDLLCPVTYDWVLFDKCSPILDVKKFARFKSGGDDEGDINCVGGGVVTALILYRRTIMPLYVYKDRRDRSDLDAVADEDSDIEQYVRLVGEELSTGMVLYRT